jgi:ankyrin repeat protein
MQFLAALIVAFLTVLPASAQVAPTEAELRAYGGLHAAAARGDFADIEKRIAAAHLGHAEVVRTLIAAGAPLDHVNNLKWTALIESIVLGDGGRNHSETLRALVEAGANVNIADGNGATPLARGRGYRDMVAILEKAGAK